jgi:MFS family permease
MRLLALATCLVLAVLAACAGAHHGPLAWLGVVALLVGAVLSVSTNGLSFTAVAEYAGPNWAGRALGIHNTGQNGVAAAAAPVVGALITASGYPLAFGCAAVAAALALLAVPAIPAAVGRQPAAARR